VFLQKGQKYQAMKLNKPANREKADLSPLKIRYATG